MVLKPLNAKHVYIYTTVRKLCRVRRTGVPAQTIVILIKGRKVIVESRISFFLIIGDEGHICVLVCLVLLCYKYNPSLYNFITERFNFMWLNEKKCIVGRASRKI